jgi:hypothetical protein
VINPQKKFNPQGLIQNNFFPELPHREALYLGFTALTMVHWDSVLKARSVANETQA